MMFDGWLAAERCAFLGRSYSNEERKHPIYCERDTPIIDTCCIPAQQRQGFFFGFFFFARFVYERIGFACLERYRESRSSICINQL